MGEDSLALEAVFDYHCYHVTGVYGQQKFVDEGHGCGYDLEGPFDCFGRGGLKNNGLNVLGGVVLWNRGRHQLG